MGAWLQSPCVATKVPRRKTATVSCSNLVVREVCDRNGSRLGLVIEPHNGTPDGVIAAARTATQRMSTDFPDASNIQSRMGATDAHGAPKWSISPNFQHLAEIETDEADYIWTGTIGASHS
jgi:hypothetical protein